MALLGNYFPQNQNGQEPLLSKISRLPWAGHMTPGGGGGVLINKETGRFTRSKDLSGNVFPCGREEFGVGGCHSSTLESDQIWLLSLEQCGSQPS